MKITHALPDLEPIYSDGEGISVLGNSKGSFAVIPPVPASRYDGVFIAKKPGKVFRFIESIEHPDPILEVVNRGWAVTRRRQSFRETMAFLRGHDAFYYESTRPVEVRLNLDCKHAYDNREWGRSYKMDLIPFGALISFSKRDDDREPKNQFGEYDLFIAIHAPNGIITPLGQWTPREHTRDMARNSPPASRFVFAPCRIEASWFVAGFGFSRAQALANALNAVEERPRFFSKERARLAKFESRLSKSSPVHSLAFSCAANSLDNLMASDDAIYAGLPWFFQVWARDSAVSAKGLSLIGRQDQSKNILMGLVASIKDGVKLSNFFSHGADWMPMQCLDGVLWTFLRLESLLADHPGLFTLADRRLIKVKLQETLSAIDASKVDGLVMNGPKETWMDTDVQGDNRPGARIEMQALTLAAMRFAKKLNLDVKNARLFQDQVKKSFFIGGALLDGRGDLTVRPNIFLAAYVYPELLTKQEWASCFDAALEKLWLEWGGLSSIAKDHQLFTPVSTGEDPKSYHHGDSWFWVNNLAALILHRTDQLRYRPQIKAILDASTRELLYLGAIGCHAELSDASVLSSKGCLSQSWSAATYIELLDELFGKKKA